MKLYEGTYSGVVKENKDPTKIGRIKAFVPVVYGVSGNTTEQVGLENIPWALPAGMPAGGSAASGGIDWIPEIGDQVWIRFLDGEPEKPVWEWGSQTIDHTKALPLHQYDALGRPKRAGITRYGNVIDFSDGAIVITTKNGYAITLENSENKQGKIKIKTPLNHQFDINDGEKRMTMRSSEGQIIELDDAASSISLFSNETLEIQTGEEVAIQTASMKVEAVGEGIDMDAFTDINITSKASIKLTVGGLALSITPTGFNFGIA